PGRADGRVAGAPREPRGAGRRGARGRRGRRGAGGGGGRPAGRALLRAGEPSVEEFLQQIALFSEQDNLRDELGLVTLMTLHNAKGLEFDTVFIIGLEDGGVR